MNVARFGPLIGSIGGLVFILINAGGLPGAAPLVVRLLGVAAFAFVIWFAIFRPRSHRAPKATPTPHEIRVYWTCVGAMAAAIPLGAIVIANVLDVPELTVCWVVLVVGAHFLPFAKTFEAPVFTSVAWTLIGLAVIGGALTLAVDAQAAAWAAVLAGVALLFFSALGAHTGGRLRSA
ncbi:hypothetical protein [Glycomyces tenuis]|uniref:hypothetical protein n=1 Tax=Glycomyces tenuis TaxID=58116 RepID=UPI000687ACFD|nr:hypothetical protein [Glycomyces tenuis]